MKKIDYACQDRLCVSRNEGREFDRIEYCVETSI